MSVQLRWIVPGRVLLIHLTGTVSLNLLERGFARLRQLRGGSLPVHVLLDLREVKRFPGNILRLQHAGSAYFHSPSAGRTLFLMKNWLHRYTLEVIWREYKRRWQIFDSLPPALTFLRSVDSTLPEMVIPDGETD
jgi:hypothetical protein